MPQTYTLTEAKAKLSELISRVHFGKETLTITRKGKPVAVVQPFSKTLDGGTEEGLIRAKGSLPNCDDELADIVQSIYRDREMAKDRKVDI